MPMRWPTSEQRNAGGRLALEAATLTSSALFAGAALYISLVEHPARCALASALKTILKSKNKMAKKMPSRLPSADLPCRRRGCRRAL